MTTSEKVAYLKGLAEGLGFDKESKEGRILDAILDILEDVAHDIEDLEDNAYELGEAIDQVSDDLSDIEDIVYDLDDEDDEDEDEGCCGSCCCDEDDEDDGEEPVFYEVTCPACENTLLIVAHPDLAQVQHAATAGNVEAQQQLDQVEEALATHHRTGH